MDVLLIIWAISNTRTVPIHYVERFESLEECRAAAESFHDPRVLIACIPAVVVRANPEPERR